ncbi:sulfur carrier protein ThiS [Myxococcota bacterium]|nr:sulfur carrier protein ThiS [Myxococcota bacterium]
MQITINGEQCTLEVPTTSGDLLAPYRAQGKAVVLELNGEIAVSNDHPIHEGDRIEIVTFVGGG